MNNLTSLFPPNYKNLEQKDAIKLLEDIEKVVEGMDKRCKNCTAGDGEFAVKCSKWNKDNFCSVCGRDSIDLRKEEK